MVSALNLPVFHHQPLAPMKALYLRTLHTQATLTQQLTAPSPLPLLPATENPSPGKQATPLIISPGCLPIPQELLKKIATWDYIDLAELLHEQLHYLRSNQ